MLKTEPTPRACPSRPSTRSAPASPPTGRSSTTGVLDCIEAFAETDFTENLKIDIPVLVAHGDDDQIVPIVAADHESIKLLPNGTLKVYASAPHGLVRDFETEFNKDLLAFIES